MECIKIQAVIRNLLTLLCLFICMSDVSAQTEEIDSVPASQQLTDKSAVQTKGSSGDESQYIEAFPEDSKPGYRIYRKDNPDNPCDRGLDAYDYEKKWYDESQIFINSKFCEPALWFDNFFADDKIFKEGAAGTYVRWRNEFTYDEEEYFDYKMRLDFSVELPGTQNRLRITFQGDEDEQLNDIAPGNGADTTNSLGLLLNLKESTYAKFNASISLAPRLLLRYRYTYPLKDDVIVRFTQELQREQGTHSALTQFDYEHTIKKIFLFRSSTQGELSEEFEGIDWLQGFALYKRLNDKTSISYEAGVSGITEPWIIATNYRLGVRFRKNFHREWLFYEIAPEYTWPITLGDERQTIEQERRSKWMLFFRLEVHFGNAHKKRYQQYR